MMGLRFPCLIWVFLGFRAAIWIRMWLRTLLVAYLAPRLASVVLHLPANRQAVLLTSRWTLGFLTCVSRRSGLVVNGHLWNWYLLAR